jgi:hypothetical protein
MNAAPSTLGKLFQMQCRYVVPIFQRGYVWTREDQWERLWEDVQEQTIILLRNPDKDIKQLRKHFMGAIVLGAGHTRAGHVAELEVIDGQQRLLTLQMLLAALRDVSASLGLRTVAERVGTLTANPPYVSEPEERFKVWPTAAYREDLKVIAASASPDDVASKYPQHKSYGKMVPERPRLIEAYLFFAERIRDFLGVAESTDAESRSVVVALEPAIRASRIADAIDQCIELAVVDLDAHDDPQVIFETLNALGVPLEPSDLVRNFIFLDAARRGYDVQALYQDCWRAFDVNGASSTKYWKETQRQGRLMRSRLDLFLFHYLTARSGQEVKMGRMYQQFRDWWHQEVHAEAEDQLRSELGRMNRWAGVFRQLLTPEGSTPLELAASRLRALDVTTVYPIVLWLAEKRDALGPGEFEGMLIDLESYLVRRMVCGLTPKNYNRIFLALLSKMAHSERPSREALQRELLTLSDESSVWPTDDEFQSRFISRPMYWDFYRRHTNMILRALESGMHSDREEDLPIPNDLTIEHVLPQKGSLEDWPLPATKAEEGQAVEDPLTTRRRLIHTVGNLTLLTQSLNSTVSNGPFVAKRPEIAKQSRLALNAYFQDYAAHPSWDEGDIRQRGKDLAELALKVWPRPVVR